MGRRVIDPKKKKISYGTRLRPDQINFLQSQKNAAGLLEKLIDDEMKRQFEEEMN